MDTNWFKNIIEKITIIFSFKKINSPSYKNIDKTRIENKPEIQIINQGITPSEAIKLINTVLDQRLVSLENKAREYYQERRHEFVRFLTDKIKELPEEEISKLQDPDTQLALIDAANISGRKQNSELRNLLSNLVIKRIKNDNSGKEELKNIVFNEAISTINKLTVDQLKIITLCYLLKYAFNRKINSWSALDEYLNTRVKPFTGFKNTDTEFRHVEYAGCGSIGLVSWNILNVFKFNYSFLFLKLFPKQTVDKISIPDEIKNQLFVLDPKEDKYIITVKNINDLDKYLNQNSRDENLNNKIIKIFKSNLIEDIEVKENLIKETVLGKDIINLIDNTDLKHLSLTSVGIAIAITYYEQTTRDNLDIDVWIN
jgi:hypothetical protein